MVKKYDLKCKQVKGQSSNEERGQNLHVLFVLAIVSPYFRLLGNLKK